MHSSDSGFDSDGSGSSTHSSGFWRSSGRFPAWRCDPAFGVVHQDGCAVCRHYMSHVVEGSKDSFDSSFQEAIGEREGSVMMRYAEGVEEGRRVQAEKDRTRILKYRSEREDARAKKEEERTKRHRAEDEAKRLRAEMRELQDAFTAMQVAYEEQISALTIGPSLGEGEMEVLRMMELQDALLNESTVTRTCSEEFLAVPGPSGTKSAAEGEEQERAETSAMPEPIADLEESPRESRDVGPHEERNLALTQEEAKGLLDRLSQNPICPNALLQLRDFCLEAHRTTPDKRTHGQKFVLQEAWKIPLVMGRKVVTSTAPPLGSLPEIFVDASGQGIGFWWEGQWAAWKLEKGWMKDGREISWAEMVAVELGVRTLIAAGVKSTHIRVRSDNQQVVTALSAQTVRNSQETRILAEVLSLCRSSGIVAMPIWVWTKSNPADPLSRCQYPSWESHVKACIDIPDHLREFVRDVRPRSA